MGYSNSEESNPVEVAFCDWNSHKGAQSGFLQSTPQGYSCLAITNDVVHNTFHLLFIKAEDGTRNLR